MIQNMQTFIFQYLSIQYLSIISCQALQG